MARAGDGRKNADGGRAQRCSKPATIGATTGDALSARAAVGWHRPLVNSHGSPPTTLAYPTTSQRPSAAASAPGSLPPIHLPCTPGSSTTPPATGPATEASPLPSFSTGVGQGAMVQIAVHETKVGLRSQPQGCEQRAPAHLSANSSGGFATRTNCPSAAYIIDFNSILENIDGISSRGTRGDRR